MGSFFSLEGGFFGGMGKIFDVVFVSILWVLCCIPVITIGPATTALYYCVVKAIRRERGYISKEFFHSFKQNFKQGAIVGIIFTVLGVLMSINFYVVRQMKGNMAAILFGIYMAMSIVAYVTAIYAFPNLSRFTLTVKNVFKNSLIMAIRHLLSTIIMAIIILVAGVVMYVIPITTFFLPGVACLLVSLLMEKILKRYTPESTDTLDAWYME
ncbi:YesL family protein [Anaerosporobacter faecicola]|uniref:YesL family protein n=1 Tax=Anaerosporobacter faecicola TaxID=2718714 RepID=UPI00143C882D|nr:YesL family protein [Anaerosporobacter faecicola]